MPGTIQALPKPKGFLEQLDEIEEPKPFLEQLNAIPAQGVISDTAKRVGRSLVDQPGALVESGGTMLGIMARAFRATDAAQADAARMRRGEESTYSATKEIAKPSAKARVVEDVGRQMRKDQAELYTGDFAPDPARDKNLLAKVADSSGSMAAAVATPGGLIAKTATGAMLNSQGAADDAERIMIQRGATEQEARDEAARQFVLNLPAGALESVAWGKLLGRYGKTLENAVAEKFGKDALRRIAKATGEQAVIEGGEEGLQQLAQNTAAKTTFAPERSLGEGVKDAATVGAVMGGGLGGTLQTTAEVAAKLGDTGRNKPESTATLQLQQRQLTKGERVAQMFPKGTPELDLPAGMQRVEAERGIFHFNPEKMSAADIETLSGQGRENLLLGLGKFSKDEVMQRAADGEPLATITERAPDGTEARSAVVTPSTLPDTKAAMERGATPGHQVKLENIVDTLRRRQDDSDAAAQKAATVEDQTRTERFNDKQGRRERFDIALGAARDTYGRRATATFAEIDGALNAVRFYAEDNSVGLLPEQKAAAVKATQLLEKLKQDRAPAEQARRDAEQQQRATAAAADKQAQATRIQQERADLAAREREVKKTGMDPETKARLYDKAPEAVLTKWAAAGDKKAERRLIEMSEAPANNGDDLLTVLKKVKLPSEDATLRGELEMLKNEGVNFGERQQLFSNQPGSLDRVAEVLRVDHGFTDIQTPADVINFAERALRGEKILPDWRESGRPAFARGKQTQLTETEVNSRWQSMRTAFPELEREWQFLRGEVQDVLEKAGYRGEVPADVQASVLPPELLAQWQRKRAERGMIVFAERMLSQPGKASRLMLHELGHRYWDSLPVETQEALRDLHRQEVTNRTGPLFDANGEPATDISFLPEDFDAAELKNDPDLPLREWFAERLAQINAAWANGRISSRDTLMARVAFDLREILQRIQRWMAQVQGRRVESALLEREFRRFLRQGAKQLDAAGRAEAVNYAREARTITITPELADKTVPVVMAERLSGNTAQALRQAARTTAANWLGEPIRNEDTGTDIVVTGKSLNHGFSHKGLEHIRAVPALPELIRTAVHLAEEAHQPATPDIKKVHRYAAAMDIDGRLLRVKLTVKERANGQLLYDHEATEIETPDGKLLPRRIPQGKLDSGPTSGATVTIGQLFSGVKPGQAVEFARKRKNPRDAKVVQAELDQVQQQLDGLKESQEDQADIETRGAELTKKQAALQKELVRAKRDDQVAASLKPLRNIDDRVDEQTGDVIVPSIVPVDRKAALRGELERGQQLLADGTTEGNTAAKTEGQRLVRLATQRLDDEFPGWATVPAPVQDVVPPGTPQPPPAAPAGANRKAQLLAQLKVAESNARRDVVGAESWATKYREQLDEEFPGWETKPAGRTYEEPAAEEPGPHPADLETDPFAPDPEPVDAAATAAKRAELEGQGLEEPSAVLNTWEKLKATLQSFRGSLPEVPTFPWTKLAQKGDQFLQGNPTFYNRLKLGLRLLRSSNDYVYKTAEHRVASITRPLLAAGRGTFDSDAYNQLRKRQTQLRKLREEGKTVPPGVAAEVRALQSKLADNPLMLFQRAVLYLDMEWRAKNLKDDEDNPIRLPMGLTQREAAGVLTEISQQIGASPHRQVIEQALEKHLALVKQTADDLKERGLLAAEHLQNPFYFPHIIVEKTAGNLARVAVDTSADFRGYLITPMGSSKAIETDYTRAMYYHLVQVFAHNQRADIVRDYFQRYDIMPQVKEAAARLTKRYGRPVSWNEAFHTEFADNGFQLYGAGEGDIFPAVQIDRERLAMRLGVPITGEDIQKQLAKLGMDGIKLLPGDLQDVVNNGAREMWVLPEHVAEALRGMIKRENGKAGPVESALAGIQGLWKKHILYAPWNYIRYEYGNTLADLEKLFSADPLVFSKLSASAKELREFYEGADASEDLQQAMKLGVLQSITAHELNALPELKAFEELQTTKQKWGQKAKARLSSLLVQPITVPADLGDRTTVQLSQFREAMFRYAKFKADMERMRNGAAPVYAGAYWKDVEAIEDSKPGAGDASYIKAAMISRSTFGDYGDLSVGGETLRRLVIPFYSWVEVNFKYHANLFRNYRDAVAAGEISRAEATKAGARAGAVMASGLTRRAAAAFLFRLALPYAAVTLWNTLQHADIEDELSEEDRRRFHLNVGRTSDGRPLVIYMPTAFSDVVKWFSGPEFARLATDYVRGRVELGAAFSEWRNRLVPDFLNNTLQSIGPLYKAPYTLLSKKSAFPDVTDQRTVPSYDMGRVILGQMTDQFTADMIMRVSSKDYYASRDMKDWARQLILQARVRDPEQWAFYQVKDQAGDFLEARLGQRRNSDYDAPDQQVLRNFRRAIFRGDVENATKFYLRLLQFGYTSERFSSSIRAQDPLAGLPKELRADFVRTLSDWERDEVLTRAYKYYTRMSDARGQEQALFPREKWGQRGAEYYQAKPQTNRLQAIIDMKLDMPDDVLSERAMMELRRSLAPTTRLTRPPRR